MIISEVINHEKLTPGQEQWMLSTQRKELAEFMKKNCSNIIETYNYENRYLYHGMRSTHSHIFMAQTREDRLPRDTPEYVQIKLDKILASQGFTALRSNSIFCTSDFKFVHDYGSPFMIFPINGFTYTWNTTAKDLFQRYELRYDSSLLTTEMNKPDLDPKKFISDFNFKNNEGLLTALRKENEVCIHGSYIGIECESNIIQIMLPILGLNHPNLEDYYGHYERKR